MKPFNLKEALAGAPCITAAGDTAYVRYQEVALATLRPLIGFVARGGDTHATVWRLDGTADNEDSIVGMAPLTRLIGGCEVPAPEGEAPAEGTLVFAPSLRNDLGSVAWLWSGNRGDHLALERGVVFLSEEDAVANANAIHRVIRGAK